MNAQNEKMPFGIGRFTGGTYLLILILLVGIAVGIFAYAVQHTQGEGVTGLRNIGSMGGATWGLYVTTYIYFMGLSFAGITLAIVIRLFDLEQLKPIARMAEVLAVVAVLVGAINIIVDVGQPWRALLNLFRYARPQSPFFGTFTLVIAGEIFAALVYLYLGGRRDAAILAQKPGRLQDFHRWWAAGYRDTPAERERHRKASLWLSIAILPLLLTAFSTVGFIFGLQVGRPGWFSALQAPGFVILAGLSGIGVVVIIAALLRATLRMSEKLNMKVFRGLANLLLVLTAVYLYFTVVEWLSSTYTGHQQDSRVAAALLTGEYAWIFWLTLAFLAIPFMLLVWQYVRQSYSLSLIVLSGVLVNLAAFGRRYLIVVPSQTHGSLLPYGSGFYSPTWVEYGVLIGLVSLGVLLYFLFAKVFPIMEVQHTVVVAPKVEGGD